MRITIKALLSIPNLKNKTVLEFGCCTGENTLQIAPYVKKVVALEIRDENLIKCPKLDNVVYLKRDVHILESDLGYFDILYHDGVLYHLITPIDHLRSLSKFGDILILSTEYARDKQCNYTEGVGNRAGIHPYSVWLTIEQITNIIESHGFPHIVTLADDVEHHRLMLICFKEDNDAYKQFSGLET